MKMPRTYNVLIFFSSKICLSSILSLMYLVYYGALDIIFMVKQRLRKSNNCWIWWQAWSKSYL